MKQTYADKKAAFSTRPLTAREREIAWLSAEFTTAEIAERLGISPHTVARHVDAARLKLGVKNKRELPAALRTLPPE